MIKRMKLEEMSLEELWQLFPIFLVPHKNEWAEWYEEEKAEISALIPKEIPVTVTHIGSTAIKEIAAKNIVDILIETDTEDNMNIICNKLVQAGRICMNREKSRISLNKGYTENGFADRVFHYHLRLKGDNDEIYFCRYMNEHPEAAKEYEKLKTELWHKFEFNRDTYTEAKTDFIRFYTEKAKQHYN